MTAVFPDAPPLLQWAREDARNPVSWYLWNGGSAPEQWSLPRTGFVPVTGVTLKPSMWGGGQEHQGKGVVFLLEGARESRTDAGLALFPSTLRSELHGIRATIEAFSRKGTPEGMESATACGVMAQENAWDHVFRVTTSMGTTLYKIDRWD